ncbi:hypothetical protein N7534_005660 [Penicillium rubens]|nr:hypothetical protein N7534_005660 [Penicillium rubens]
MHWARLKRMFEIAKQFDVVLLLDEVDAFMERPIASHGSHNRLIIADANTGEQPEPGMTSLVQLLHIGSDGGNQLPERPLPRI